MSKEQGYKVQQVLHDIQLQFDRSQLALPELTLEIPEGKGEVFFHDIRAGVARARGLLLPNPVFKRNCHRIAVRFRNQFVGTPDLRRGSLTKALTEFFILNSHRFLTLDGTARLLQITAEEHPETVAELRKIQIPTRTVFQVLRGLLRESVSIRDLQTILSSLIQHRPMTCVPEELVELTRSDLAPYLCECYADPSQILRAVTVNEELEARMREKIERTDLGSFFLLEPVWNLAIMQALDKQLAPFQRAGMVPVVITAPDVRPHLRKLTARPFPHLAVLSWNEIAPDYCVEEIGQVAVLEETVRELSGE